jgi:AcrR family transcriptional regulator
MVNPRSEFWHAMGTRTALDETRRDAILDAALDCFLLHGVAGTTIDDLRSASGASVGCIYHHFGGKEQLAAALYVQILASYHDAFLASLKTSRSARAGVEGAVHHHLRWVAARPSHAKYLFHCREPEVVSESNRAAKELNVSFYAEAGGWLADHVRQGRIRALAPELYHALWMGPSLEYTRQWLAGSNRPWDQLTGERQLAEAAWNALRVVR